MNDYFDYIEKKGDDITNFGDTMRKQVLSMLETPAVPLRGRIIDDAVKVEWMVSIVNSFSIGLGFKSRSFGRTGLSFFQKINMLFDLEYLDKSKVLILQTFAEIRNQFAHYNKVKTLEDCYPELITKLRSLYKATQDEPLISLYERLAADSKTIMKDLYLELIDRMSDNAEQKIKADFYDKISPTLFTMIHENEYSRDTLVPVMQSTMNDMGRDSIENFRKYFPEF